MRALLLLFAEKEERQWNFNSQDNCRDPASANTKPCTKVIPVHIMGRQLPLLIRNHAQKAITIHIMAIGILTPSKTRGCFLCATIIIHPKSMSPTIPPRSPCVPLYIYIYISMNYSGSAESIPAYLGTISDHIKVGECYVW